MASLTLSSSPVSSGGPHALGAGMASPSQQGQPKNGIYCKAALVALCLKEKWENVVADGLQGKSLTTALL